jgi:hypothetical protein
MPFSARVSESFVETQKEEHKMAKRSAWFLIIPLVVSALLSTSQPTAANSLSHLAIGLVPLPAAITLTPVADAYVHQSHPSTNYGTAKVLSVDGNPAQRSYLRFDVQGLTGSVTKATLRLYASNSSKGGLTVHVVSSNAWGETTITYNNAPAVGTVVQSSGSFGGNAWLSVDVTTVITGNGTYSLALTETSNSGINLGSRESSTPPQLIVETATSPTATPIPPTATRVPPTNTPLPPTATAVPPTNTATSVPPTNTPTSVPPTSTMVPPTATPMPPTATNTATSLATNTPTNTPTPIPPTATPIPPTATPIPPTATPTSPVTRGPIHAAFFYPWFPQAWTQLGIYPYTNYHPSFGYYSSTDDAIIDQQLQLAAQAHLDAFISSWWGQGHYTDSAFQHILARSERAGSPNPNLRWAIYYENEGQGDPTSTQILGDLNYLASNAFSHPGYLHINGKPVVFVYADPNDACGMADRWVQAKTAFGGNVYLVLKVFAGYGSCASQPDAWHQYAPAKDYDVQGSYSAVVSPGFWKVGESPRLARDPVRFEADVQKGVASGAFWQLITTWSEWGEGTIIEPATEWGNQYIDILCRNWPGSTPCPGSATPTPTSALPTATPVPATATPVPATATAVSATATPTATAVSPTATPTSSAGTVTLNPVADSYVDSANPSTNYGTSTQIRVDGSPIVNSYLRFNVQGLSGSATQATLRLYANSALTSGYSVQRVADNTWGETTINYGNAPAIGAAIGATGAVSANTWTSVDVTAYITGNGAFSFALTDPSTTALSLASREAANKPELVLSTGGGLLPTPTATPIAPTATPVSPTSTPAVTSTPTVTPVGPTATSMPPTATSIAPTATSVPPTATNVPPAPTSTPVPSGNDPIVLATGDSRTGCNSGATATANLLSRYPSSTLLLFNGDATDTGAYSEFTNCFDTTFGKYKAEIRPEPGNHEYGTSGASGYFGYYGAQAHSPGYYSFDIGAWHIVGLNSEIDVSATSAQLAWLKNDLAANRTQCTLAYWHEPRWSSGNHGNNTFVSALWQTLYDNNVDLVFNGHDHDYERFAPQNPSGVADSARGIREFVIGTAGAPPYAFSTIRANSEAKMTGSYGLVQFTLHPSSYDWTFVPATGSFADSGSTLCH